MTKRQQRCWTLFSQKNVSKLAKMLKRKISSATSGRHQNWWIVLAACVSASLNFKYTILTCFRWKQTLCVGVSPQHHSVLVHSDWSGLPLPRPHDGHRGFSDADDLQTDDLHQGWEKTQKKITQRSCFSSSSSLKTAVAMVTSILQTAGQRPRRSTLLAIDGEHTDQVRLIRVNTWRHKQGQKLWTRWKKETTNTKVQTKFSKEILRSSCSSNTCVGLEILTKLTKFSKKKIKNITGN